MNHYEPEPEFVTRFKHYIAAEAKRGGYYKPPTEYKLTPAKQKPTPPPQLLPFWDMWTTWDKETKPFP